MNVKLSGILQESIVDGPGLRYVVFAQGCPHKCKGCHNPKTHTFNGGLSMSVDSILDEFDANPFLDGITLSGGEPFCQPKAMLALVKGVKERGKSVVVYSGWTFEELTEKATKHEAVKNLLYASDILIDGRYEEAKKDLKLAFRGSGNQGVIDMVKSVAYGGKFELCL